MKPITNEVLGFDPADYNKLEDLPVISIGCDSIYSWDPRFKHLWEKRTGKQLAEDVIQYIPHNQWRHPRTGQPTILSLTGGEPTLQQKFLPELLEQQLFDDLELILIETNCSVPLRMEFIDYLNTWTAKNPKRRIIWSNSPKLSVSGEAWDKAIVPSIALNQRLVLQSEQYFKFVCDDSDESFDEVEKAMSEYYAGGVPAEDNQIYIMPVGAIEEQQLEIAGNVALKCLDRGFIFCGRAHVHAFGNTIGT
jgi:organic radical activating enzyme